MAMESECRVVEVAVPSIEFRYVYLPIWIELTSGFRQHNSANLVSIALICRPNQMSLNIVVRVGFFFSLLDGGPKTWMQGKTLLTQTVDIHSYSFLQLVDFIAEHYMWGSKQYITLWRELEYSMEIKSDEQLLEWFQLNLDKGIVRINAQINDFEGPLQCSPSKRRCHPSVRNKAPTTTNERATETPINESCLLYTSPSPRDGLLSRMPSSA